MKDPDDGEMIGMTRNEMKKYASVDDTNGHVIVPEEEVKHLQKNNHL